MKKISSFLFTAALFTVLLLSSCGGGGITGKSPSDIVKSGINAIKDKDYSGAMKYYKKSDGTEFTQEENKKMNMLFTMATSKLETKKGLKNLDITEEKISDDGNSATVKYKMIFNDGSEETSDVTLRKFNGSWFMIVGK